jgi:gamma-glutamylcyclotransferase (GGCT)/AIG2-like uncharacterized protein YtfP
VNDSLFVYGTLQSGFSNPAADRLRRESRPLGPATAHGHLYDVSRVHITGRYPGFVPDSASGAVHGELLQIPDPNRTFPWLDPYEGSEYERRLIEVMDSDGRKIDAWCYVYAGSVEGLALLRAGRWMYGEPAR